MDQALHDITERIQAAAGSGTRLRIRGGGTKDFHGNALGGEVLDTRALSGITNYEPSELVVTARAGTPLAELEALLAQSGQCLPFEPPRFSQGSTVGGMVAAGLSGPARASAGSVRDYVLGATLVNGKGQALVFGGTVMKNVAGYDVSRLVAGSMGTLALITDVSLKVLPVAPAEATLRFDMDQATALKALNDWGGQPLPLNASCWVDGVLHVRLRGAVAAVEAACSRVGGERQPVDLWNALRDQTHPFFTPASGAAVWRLCVAQSSLPLDLPSSPLIEWHGGQRWLQAPASDAQRIRDIARAAGGHATLWRDGTGKTAQAFSPLAAPLDRMNRALRESFDPHGVFNTGRL